MWRLQPSRQVPQWRPVQILHSENPRELTSQAAESVSGRGISSLKEVRLVPCGKCEIRVRGPLPDPVGISDSFVMLSYSSDLTYLTRCVS